MDGVIRPKVLKGFRDSLPDREIPRRKLIRALEDHFISYGFVPIDTPALEYAEILLSKGGGETDKQTYRFTDRGGRDVSLRFDLTIPFARYVALHQHDIAMPFKRYHIAKVWRGENTQRGRYREFVQCDFDIVGTNAITADLEIMLMMAGGLKKIGAGKNQIRFSHRGVFNNLLNRLGLENQSIQVLRIVDKMSKLGAKEIRSQLTGLVGGKNADLLLDFITVEKDNPSTLTKMTQLAQGFDGRRGSPSGPREKPPATEQLGIILDAVDELTMQENLVLDPSITRGLDYYTGIVFETYLENLPSLGSVCSGGRYDNLTGLFTRNTVSGVGASIGLDRLMTGLEELDSLNLTASNTDILILSLDEGLLVHYQRYARDMRENGLSAEVYPEPKKIGAQFKYAESRDIPLALIVGPEEKAAGIVNLKDLRTRDNYNGISFEKARVKARDLISKKHNTAIRPY